MPSASIPGAADPLLGHGRQVIVREDWLRLTEEPVLEPGMPIVDPHHHLWQRGEGSYLLPELLADIASGHDIRGTIFVQCGEMYRAAGPAEEQSREGRSHWTASEGTCLSCRNRARTAERRPG